MVLVVTVVLAIVVTAIATYSATNLRYGQVVEARAGRLAAAQGALDDAIEQLTLQNPICPTAGGAGIDVPFPEPINGANVVVNCQLSGTTLPELEGWAIVVTGEGAPSGTSPIFDLDNSQPIEIGGPVFVQQPNRVSLKSTTRIVQGDFWYPDVACAESAPGDPGIQYQSSTLSITNLTFDVGRGPYCINRNWDQLFASPPPVSADVATFAANPAAWNPPYTASGSCRVFEPGYYTTAPDLGSSNYFRSGVYVFDDVGLVTLQGKTATFGQIVRQGFPAIENTACNAVRNADDPSGATLYTRGDTRFETRSNSGLEISGREQGNASVSLHVLDTSLAYSSAYMGADNGNKKEMAFQGLVWAPTSSFVFDTVPVDKAAMLRGGAVVASYRGRVAASASGFLIEVAAGPANTRLVLNSTATDDRGASTVRAVVQYRPSTGEVAVNSRRVLDAP